MNLIYLSLDLKIELKRDLVNTIVVESPFIYRTLVGDMIKSINGETTNWVLADIGGEHNWKKDVYLVTDFFTLDFNNRTLLSKLQQRLANIAQENVGDLFDINGKIQKFLYTIEDAIPLNLVHNEDINALDLIKMAGVRIDEEAFDLIDQSISFIDVVMELLHPKLIVLLHPRCFMTQDELGLFFSTVLSKKIPILCIEQNLADQIQIVDNKEVVYTIDSDYCVF
ncbi:type II-A CRISPR-associated protein Csn2 [uncultured Veillonella sp.]|uniref:type II-A CRISPR-associated protein Csn2 n=1 Tax=uncultured Veillonella sp. TaxID=159268 RepID=UPI0026335B07|nr:type II-A CRISPR-associated protein Csn2 [uncultured Veillonella sp.]